MLSSTGPRERILVIGTWGAGKSYCAVDLAQSPRRNPETHIQVIDTTFEAERNFIGCEVDIATVESWDDYMKAIRKFRATAKPQDWLVIDRGDAVWDAAQSGYTEKAHGTSIDEWFIGYRKEHESGNAFAGDYGIHWGAIKRMYGAFMSEMMKYPGNVLVTAKAETVTHPNSQGRGGDPEPIRQEYGKFGVKPAGEKNLGFMFHTVLLLAERKPEQWVFTTIRDRGREQQKQKEMTGFVVSYLVGVAGWKL